MQERTFTIGTIEKAQKVVDAARNTMFEADLVRGRYLVDLRSIMGVLSIDIAQPAVIRIHTSDVEEGEKFFNRIEEILN